MKNTIAQFQTMTRPMQSSVRPIVLSGLAVLAVAMSMYVYFVGKIVFDVVARRNAEVAIKAEQSSISTLGVNYFGEMKKVDLAQAENVGLSESHDIVYASRATPAATVGMLSER